MHNTDLAQQFYDVSSIGIDAQSTNKHKLGDNLNGLRMQAHLGSQLFQQAVRLLQAVR